MIEHKGKVYRQTFAKQTNRLLQEKPLHEIPATLQSEYEIDVTEAYFPANHLTFECTYPVEGEKFAYLCLFNNREWVPVGWTEIKERKARFDYLDGRNVAYLAAYFKRGKLIPFSDPVTIIDSYWIQTLRADTLHTDTVRAYRKFPGHTVAFYHNLMISGKFQVANNKDFADAKTIAEIARMPEGFDYAYSSDTVNTFRYVRYFSNWNRGDIAEMEIYGTDSISPFTGIPFGTPSYAYWEQYAAEKAFDRDPLTSFVSEYETNAWTALDLGRRQRISKIRYIPRSDDNSIRLSDEYELFYWSPQGWTSLGRQTATNYYLDFENAPRNALFWLRNHTRGREERIFTYENGAQRWW